MLKKADVNFLAWLNGITATKDRLEKALVSTDDNDLNFGRTVETAPFTTLLLLSFALRKGI